MRTDVDIEDLKARAVERMGDVLQGLGARVRGSAARGRGTCPGHNGDSLSVSYANGFATCHSGCGGRTYDAIAIVRESLGLGFRKAVDEVATILGETAPLRQETQHDTGRAYAEPKPRRDPEALWRRLAPRDEAAEAYLSRRRLLTDPLPLGFMRFNVGGSGDPWLDQRAGEGYRAAFPACRAVGTVQTLVLRFCGTGAPLEAFGKAPAMPGCSTSGAGICRPEIALLASGDAEFERDEIVVTEGPTDTLAATAAFDVAALEQDTPPTWVLGALGVSNAPWMIRAFSAVVRGRVVHLAFDSDPAGEKAIPAAALAAREAGARRVTRMRARGSKDIAAAWEALHGT